MCGTIDRWTGKEKVEKAQNKQAALQAKLDAFNAQVKYNQDHIRAYMPKVFNLRYQNTLRDLKEQMPDLEAEMKSVNDYAKDAADRGFWGDLAGMTFGVVDGYINDFIRVVKDVSHGDIDQNTVDAWWRNVQINILIALLILAPEGWQMWLAAAALVYGADSTYNNGRLMGATFRAIDGLLDDILGIDQDRFLGIKWENNFIGDFTYNTFNSNGEYYQLAMMLANLALQLANGWYNMPALAATVGKDLMDALSLASGAMAINNAYEQYQMNIDMKKANEEKVEIAKDEIKRKEDMARKRYISFRDMEAFDFMTGFIFTKQAGSDDYFDPMNLEGSLAVAPSVNNQFMKMSDREDFTYHAEFDGSIMAGGSSYLRGVFVGI